MSNFSVSITSAHGLALLGPQASADEVIAKSAGIILWMRPANERWRYIVTSFLIGWANMHQWETMLQ